MAQILSIAATLNEPGLVAFECRRCGHKTSVLEPVHGSREN
jgi:hypothetical protein